MMIIVSLYHSSPYIVYMLIAHFEDISERITFTLHMYII